MESRETVPDRTVEAWFDTQPYPTGIYLRESIWPGDRLQGPAILCERTSTTVIDPGWEAEVLSEGELLLTDQGSPTIANISTECDPVMLEVFNNQFAGIAKQMGVTLRNTATAST